MPSLPRESRHLGLSLPCTKRLLRWIQQVVDWARHPSAVPLRSKVKLFHICRNRSMNGPWRKISFEKLWGINGSRELNISFLQFPRIKPLRNALPTKTKTLRVFEKKNRFLSTLSGILLILRRRFVIVTARKLAGIMLRPYFLTRKSELLVIVWLDKQLFLAQSLANFFDTIAMMI